jgi:hypothetical protein
MSIRRAEMYVGLIEMNYIGPNHPALAPCVDQGGGKRLLKCTSVPEALPERFAASMSMLGCRLALPSA